MNERAGLCERDGQCGLSHARPANLRQFRQHGAQLLETLKVAAVLRLQCERALSTSDLIELDRARVAERAARE